VDFKVPAVRDVFAGSRKRTSPSASHAGYDFDYRLPETAGSVVSASERALR
jgi:hypothetical protein